eukprot:7387982-Prymnesium_polylepis.1
MAVSSKVVSSTCDTTAMPRRPTRSTASKRYSTRCHDPDMHPCTAVPLMCLGAALPQPSLGVSSRAGGPAL